MKTVLITGSTSGIGAETARLFAKNGFSVIINGRDEKRGQATAKEVGGIFIKADVTVPNQVVKLFNQIKSLDVLINNVGGVVGNDFFDKAKEEDLQKSFNANFFSAFYCSQQASKIIKNGAIVNVASICGFGMYPAGPIGLPIYSAAKAALLNLSQNMAKLLAPNIRVNAVVPGYTKTGPTGLYMSLLVKAKLNPQTLVGRINDLKETASVIYMAATNEAMTGSQIVVDGGALVK
ncbi:MAG: Short chain dehydrogenase [Candidatus Woesebacteria bacterium GW2011_GWB1_39_10]|uniref:Short chain dehydrogenase n=1 Tax=Candidatus Woesebacteria bacterium GW2011_GWB1_39_10 TaxID=1618572 RepID=A0A0G0LKD9_9BACT|nr:MAG: Short chain dehydrogenase [Candidatus Woesebacteria bacterium GW2011_GWB1_39_10]